MAKNYSLRLYDEYDKLVKIKATTEISLKVYKKVAEDSLKKDYIFRAEIVNEKTGEVLLNLKRKKKND